MGLTVMAGSDTAWDRTRVCSDALNIVLQCLRPLLHFLHLKMAFLFNIFNIKLKLPPGNQDAGYSKKMGSIKTEDEFT